MKINRELLSKIKRIDIAILQCAKYYGDNNLSFRKKDLTRAFGGEYESRIAVGLMRLAKLKELEHLKSECEAYPKYKITGCGQETLEAYMKYPDNREDAELLNLLLEPLS